MAVFAAAGGGASIGDAYITVRARTDKFGDEAEKGVSGGLQKIAKVGAVLFGTALAVGAAGHFVANFVRAGAESEKIGRITDSVIKSTGAAAASRPSRSATWPTASPT